MTNFPISTNLPNGQRPVRIANFAEAAEAVRDIVEGYDLSATDFDVLSAVLSFLDGMRITPGNLAECVHDAWSDADENGPSDAAPIVGERRRVVDRRAIGDRAFVKVAGCESWLEAAAFRPT